MCVCLCLCVINCQEEWLAAWGFGQNSAVLPGLVSRHPPSAQTIPTRQFSSSATTGMGENSPTMYGLQCCSLKTWVNFHPGRMARQICMFFYYFKISYFTNVHNLLQAQGGKSSWQSLFVFLFVTQIFIDLRILKWIYGWIFTHCVRRMLKWMALNSGVPLRMIVTVKMKDSPKWTWFKWMLWGKWSDLIFDQITNFCVCEKKAFQSDIYIYIDIVIRRYLNHCWHWPCLRANWPRAAHVLTSRMISPPQWGTADWN